MMGGAFVAVEQSRTGREQRAGTDRDKADAGPDGSLQPVDDLRLARGVVGAPAAGRAERLVYRTGYDDEGAVGQPVRQRRNGCQIEPDRARHGGRRANIADSEAHRLLVEVRPPQHLHRPGDVEQQRPRRHDHEDGDDPRLPRLAHAAAPPCRPASASSTVTMRAKRPASTSSVRARMSAALHSRPAASVIGKVSVASPT